MTDNANGVTRFLREKTGDPNSAQCYVEAVDGGYCHEDAEGEFWRMYNYVEAI